MTYDRLATIRTEADAVVAAARQGFEPKVPGCPEWTVGDLVYHLGSVYRFHAAHVTRGVTDEPEELELVDPPDEELLAWFATGAEALVSTLQQVDPQLPAWNWAPHTPQVARWWHRRMAVESAVHRWDAESAYGEPRPIALEVAVDGIDEMLHVIGPAHTKPTFPTGTVVIRATDAQEWAVRIAPDAFEVLGTVPETPDAALEGAASALLLAMWGRQVPVSATGDRDLIAVLT